jgi:hypothetical protein
MTELVAPSSSERAIRRVTAIRYVLPLREGGSVPALVEADDLGMYVVKLAGAGQGVRALIAELIAGELARAAGLPVPEIVVVDLDAAIADSEPDPELAMALERSVGANVGLDYLPGSVTFDVVAGGPPDATLASRVVLFDAFATNVDRTPRNPNILSWHGGPWLIDHGACLYMHHGWSPATRLEGARDPYVEVRDHVFLRYASRLDDAAVHLAATLGDAVLRRVVDAVPPEWLEGSAFPDAGELRTAYVEWLRARREAMPVYLEEAKRAHAERV